MCILCDSQLQLIVPPSCVVLTTSGFVSGTRCRSLTSAPFPVACAVSIAPFLATRTELGAIGAVGRLWQVVVVQVFGRFSVYRLPAASLPGPGIMVVVEGAEKVLYYQAQLVHISYHFHPVAVRTV